MSKRPQVIDSTTAWLSKIEFRLRGIQSILYNGGGVAGALSGFYSIIGDPGQPAAGDTITYSALIGKSVIAILINGTAINTSDYTFNNTTGEIDLTVYGGVNDGAEIIVLYK